MQRIFLVGYMGSGKTAMGRLLAQKLGFDFIDLDNYIETKYHKTIAQIFEQSGEDGFRLIEKNCLHEIADFEKVVIATGGGAPCFFDNMDYMNERGATIYLKIAPGHLAKRLSESKNGVRPLIAGKHGKELQDFIAEGLRKREFFYDRAQHIISGNDDEIIRQINQFRIS